MANLPENDDIEISPTFSLDSLPDDQAEDQAKDQAHLMTIQDEYSQKSSTPNQRFCIGFDSSMHFAGTSTVNVNFTDCGRDITNLLTQHLPPYVVSCFLAAGYDTLDVIADMSVSSKPGNSLEVVEKYINDQYPLFLFSITEMNASLESPQLYGYYPKVSEYPVIDFFVLEPINLSTENLMKYHMTV